MEKGKLETCGKSVKKRGTAQRERESRIINNRESDAKSGFFVKIHLNFI